MKPFLLPTVIAAVVFSASGGADAITRPAVDVGVTQADGGATQIRAAGGGGNSNFADHAGQDLSRDCCFHSSASTVTDTPREPGETTEIPTDLADPGLRANGADTSGDSGNLTIGIGEARPQADVSTVRAVPESSSTVLFGLGGLALIFRRRA